MPASFFASGPEAMDGGRYMPNDQIRSAILDALEAHADDHGIDIVEALDPFTAAYDLEVSSPGVDRPLRRPKDFAAYLGDRAEMTTVDPIDGRRSWTGDIVAVTETSVTVLVDGTEYEIPLASIKRANLKPDYDALLAAAKKSAKTTPESDDDDLDEDEAE